MKWKKVGQFNFFINHKTLNFYIFLRTKNMEDLTLQVELLLEDERLPPETRMMLESMYEELSKDSSLDEIEIARIVETVHRGELELDALEALVMLEEDQPNFEENLLGVSMSILLESSLLLPSTKKELQDKLDKIEQGESFTVEETEELEILLNLAESEVEAAQALMLFGETAAQEYLFAIAEKAVNM